jgi:hypothetical protein
MKQTRTRRNACSSWNLSQAGLEDRLMLSGTGYDARVFFDSAPIVEPLLPSDLHTALATIGDLSGGGGIPGGLTSVGPILDAAILASIGSGGGAVPVWHGVMISAQAIPTPFDSGNPSPFVASAGPSGLYKLLIQWNESNQNGASSAGEPAAPALLSLSLQMMIRGPGESGGLANQDAAGVTFGNQGVTFGNQAVPAGPGGFNWAGSTQGATDPGRGDRMPFDASNIPMGLHELLIRWTTTSSMDRGFFGGDAYPLLSMSLDMTFQGAGEVGGGSPRNPFAVAEIPGMVSASSILGEGGTARGQSSSSRNALRNEHDDASMPAIGPSPPTQAISPEATLRPLTSDGPMIVAEEGLGPEARAILEAASRGETNSTGQSPVTVVESDLDLPAPIGSDLLLQAWSNNAASWDEALEELVGGVDELITGLVDFEGEAAYLPWVVGAGLALAASEAARKARPRPDPYLAYVDGSAVEPMPQG